MKSYLLFLILYFLTLNVLSQENDIVIKGSIKGADGEVIENVNVFNLSNIGTVSDKNGEFVFVASKSDREIFVSHIGYEEKIIRIEEDLLGNDTVFMEIVLEKRQYLLNPVDIAGNRSYQVLKSKKVWVYDYELLGKNLLILLRDSTKYELRLLNGQDSLLFNTTLKERKVNGFIKDGLGNVHIGLNDSVFQIHIYNNRILLYEATSQAKYKSILQPIAAETNSLLLMHDFQLNNQKVAYFGINKHTKAIIPIAEIYDKERYQYSVEVKNHQMSFAGVNNMGEITFADLYKWRKYFQWGMYFDNVVTLPIYSPLIKTDSSFCIFNLIENSIMHFTDDGSFSKEVAISFNENKKILAIELDEFSNSMYSLWRKSGVVQIDKINISDGTSNERFQIRNYRIPEKISISDDNVYFLYTDISANKKLVKIPLQKLH
jgi:uncharacterized protein (UPF0262 family)